MIDRCCEVLAVAGEIQVVSLRETDGPLVWSSVVGKVAGAAEPDEVGRLALLGLESFSRERIPLADGLAKLPALFARLGAKSRKSFFARKPNLVHLDEGKDETVIVVPTIAAGGEYQHDPARRVVCPRRALEVGRAIKGFI